LPHSPNTACSNIYDDSKWRQINVPHDYVVEGEPNANADRNHGYLPFNISWYGAAVDFMCPIRIPITCNRRYRKHFTVDASWEGNLVYIDFDGVYRASDMYLNGEPQC
jgi:beta-galactosidase/beta-glucuronidase